MTVQQKADAFLFLDEVDSTNSFIMQRPALLQVDGLTLRADLQTQGRGRRDRPWAVGPAGQLYCSRVIHPSNYPIPFPSFTLLAGLACFYALQHFGVIEAKLKWPNDLLVNKKKIAGILTELKKVEGTPVLVIGLGVNLRGYACNYPDEVREVLTTIQEVTGTEVLPHDMMMAFTRQLDLLLERVLTEGFTTLTKEWEAHSGAVGSRIRFEENGADCFGVVQGLNRDGHLIVQEEGTETLKTIFSGEVFSADHIPT